MSDEDYYQEDFEEYISDDDYQINYKNFISKFPIPPSQKLDFFSDRTDEMRNILYDNEETKISKNIFLIKKKSKPQPQNFLTIQFEDDPLTSFGSNSVSFLSEPIHKKKGKLFVVFLCNFQIKSYINLTNKQVLLHYTFEKKLFLMF